MPPPLDPAIDEALKEYVAKRKAKAAFRVLRRGLIGAANQYFSSCPVTGHCREHGAIDANDPERKLGDVTLFPVRCRSGISLVT